MDASGFISLLDQELADESAREEWDELSNSAGATTLFMGKRFKAMAQRADGLVQVSELWRVDFLWFRSDARDQPYYSGNLERSYPVARPAVAIEHENYGHENVAAAFLRVLGIRTDLRVLVAWSRKRKRSARKLDVVRGQAVAAGVMGPEDSVLVVLFHEDAEDPDFHAYVFDANGFEQVEPTS